MYVRVAKEIRLKHGAPVVATFIVDRNLHPLSEAVIKGGSDAESPAATGGHRLVVCTQQQVKVIVYISCDFALLEHICKTTVLCLVLFFLQLYLTPAVHISFLQIFRHPVLWPFSVHCITCFDNAIITSS